MFDIGFLELLICGVIALLVLGPERLPTAARAAGRWIGGARRMVGQFTSELDRQLKAEELREELRKAGDVGLDDVEKTVRGALDEAKKYEHMILPDDQARKTRPAPATRRVTLPDASDGDPEPKQQAAGTETEAGSTPAAGESLPTSPSDKRS
ncbi:Sec-independent protein translocase protein TatB [Marinobacter daepoensis]|uniref:Sec-independent protein translocase protein TatB n=1 Tax=Marinobacter daepoensis TaxID=262077 RepID=UPI00041EA5EE|nr:Sec-independent protein translocase protein TatB [Marinobacter daepoensis]